MKKLLILSGKGGTGKTTTAAAFIRFAKAKAIADCDVDAPNLHIVIPPETEPERFSFAGAEKARIDPAICTGCGLCAKHCRFDALEERDGVCRVRETACEGCGVCAYVCPAKAVTLEEDVAGEQFLYRGETVFSTAMLKMGRGSSGKLVSNVKLAMAKAAPKKGLAVIDGSPGIGCPVIASVSGVDMVLIVAEPSRSGLSDLERLLKTIRVFETKTAVCVNKWDASPENTAEIERFCVKRRIPFVGKIPYDKSASAAVNQGLSLADVDCPARDALRDIFEQTSKLLG